MADYEVTAPDGTKHIVTAPPDATQDQILAYAQNNMGKTPVPSAPAVYGNALVKGGAALADSVINAPVNLYNIGKMAYGNAAYELGYKDVGDSIEITKTPDLIHSLFQKAGVIRPEAEPQTPGQRVLDSATQGAVGMVIGPGNVAKNVALGAVSGAAGQVTKEATGSDKAAITVSMLTPLAVRHGINGLGKGANNEVLGKTLKDGIEAGFAVPPSMVKPVIGAVESFEGKAAIKQQANLHNQEVANKIVRQDLKLPEGTPLTMETLRTVREEASAPYREIAALSPRAAEALTRLQQTRFDAKEHWTYYNKSGNPEAGRMARALDARAEMLEGVIDREAKKIVEMYGVKPSSPTASPKNPAPGLPQGRTPLQIETREVGFAVPSTGATPKPSASNTINVEKIGETTAGDPQLVERLRAARTLLAKTHNVERALNLGDGNVSMEALGRMLDQGKPLSGGLAIIGRWAQAFQPISREGAKVGAPSVSAWNVGAAGAGGALGYYFGDKEGAVIGGAIPFLRGPARYGTLSSYRQNSLINPPLLEDTFTKSVLAGRSMTDSLDREK